MKRTSITHLAAPEKIYESFHLTPALMQRMGGIALFSGTIEFWIERVLWVLKNEDPRGIRPSTDARPISVLIADLRNAATQPQHKELKPILDAWCDAATPAFECRNTIFHGLPLSLGPGDLSFMTNTRWHGEIRRRKGNIFVADDHVLALLEEVMATLLRVISTLQDDNDRPKLAQSSIWLSALGTARSIAIEIVDLPAAVSSEKY